MYCIYMHVYVFQYTPAPISHFLRKYKEMGLAQALHNTVCHVSIHIMPVCF